MGNLRSGRCQAAPPNVSAIPLAGADLREYRCNWLSSQPRFRAGFLLRGNGGHLAGKG